MKTNSLTPAPLTPVIQAVGARAAPPKAPYRCSLRYVLLGIRQKWRPAQTQGESSQGASAWKMLTPFLFLALLAPVVAVIAPEVIGVLQQVPKFVFWMLGLMGIGATAGIPLYYGWRLKLWLQDCCRLGREYEEAQMRGK